MHNTEHPCHHCGISFRWNPLETISEDGDRLLFCCRGCLGAFRMICSAGLGTFYQRGDRSLPTVSAADSARFSDEELSRYVTPAGEF